MLVNVYMDAQNKFLLEKIRIMAKQVEDNLKKKGRKTRKRRKKGRKN